LEEFVKKGTELHNNYVDLERKSGSLNVRKRKRRTKLSDSSTEPKLVKQIYSSRDRKGNKNYPMYFRKVLWR
jgi:hypothetical protein